MQNNQNPPRRTHESDDPRARKINRIFTFSVLGLLVCLLLASILVPYFIHRSRGEIVLSQGSVTVRRDLYLYWLSQYKSAYLSAVQYDDPAVVIDDAFWEEEVEEGVSRAAYLRDAADTWIRRVVSAAAFFEEEDTALGEKTLERIEDAYRQLLQYELSTVSAYDKEAKKIGFTYETVRRAILWQQEAENYVGNMDDDVFELFCVTADDAVTVRQSALDRIDLVTLPTDSRLYSASFMPNLSE